MRKNNKLINLFIKTHGCQMNDYDSKRISDLLAHTHSMQIVDNPELADMLVLNTCSIREKASEKVFSELGVWQKIKNKKPDTIIAVGGCVASYEGEKLQQRAPFVDIVFGPQTLHRLPNLINKYLESKNIVMDISFPEIEKFDNLPKNNVDSTSAYVSIMEGCSNYCTFCVVPYTRGEAVHRPFDDVISEVIDLVNKGVKEVTLLGQNVNAYKGKMHDGKICDLALLVIYLNAIDGLQRIRFTTSHPLDFNDNLIEAYRRAPKLANHLHLPVQSGSNKILGLMKRGHTVEEYVSKIEKLKAIRPDITISTDIIVGFPGETDEDFKDTMNLIEKIKFESAFSFIYSPRPGTLAANVPDNVPLEIKKHRLALLQQRINQLTQDHIRKSVGTLQTVLVTGTSKKNHEILTGRTNNNRIVNFAGDKSAIGKMLDIKITEAMANSLKGEIAV